VVKFADKERHQVFIEPEGNHTNEMYIAGMSSSLPEDVQYRMYRSVPGLENAKIVRNAYAIEYDCINPNQVIDLTRYLRDGVLTAKLPKGQWRLLRMGHTATGHTNATGGGAIGLECDKFSESAVRKQFNNWFGAAFSKTDPALARKVLKYMHVDSWERSYQSATSQPWGSTEPHTDSSAACGAARRSPTRC
jgi:hypothetical protein